MQKPYRVCFFNGEAGPAVAVLLLHFPSDAPAIEAAEQLLAVSPLSRVEVWQGARKVYETQAAVPSCNGQGGRVDSGPC